MIATGGKAVYGASVGILMLDAQFPRIPGDMGNATTWPFPVHYKIVRGASPERVVLDGAAGLRDTFIAAARELVADGVDGITTNCGFLSLFQEDLKTALPVPVAASSLMQVAMVASTLKAGRCVSVLTISKESLTPAHLEAAGVPPDTPIAGVDPNSGFASSILGNKLELDVDGARQDMLKAGKDLVQAYPDTGAIVLECTNMIPYAADLRDALGVPVYSIYNFVTWFQASLMPPRFALAARTV